MVIQRVACLESAKLERGSKLPQSKIVAFRSSLDLDPRDITKKGLPGDGPTTLE